MGKSTGENPPPLAPFLKKCYEMVEDEDTDPIISWGSGSDTFVIWDMTQFSIQLLPKYFKHSNFSSFMRQLNIYGFRKVDTDRWEFANDGFIKGKKHLLGNIFRRKNLLVATDQNKPSPPQDNGAKLVDKMKDTTLLKEVENLKNDKNTLMQEFIKLRRLQESSESNLVMLRERLQGMEKNQQQMLSFLVMAMQNPGVLFQLLQVKESTWRMAERENMLEGEEYDEQEGEEEEVIISEGTIVRYQPNTPLEPEIQISSASGLENTRASDNQHVDRGKDAFLSIDFLKRLMDEKFWLDSHDHVILPDMPDDGTWKDLLLAYPFVDKTTSEEKQDYLPSTESFDLLMKQMQNTTEDDESEGEFDSDNGDLDRLTMQMQLSFSDTNPPAH